MKTAISVTILAIPLATFGSDNVDINRYIMPESEIAFDVGKSAELPSEPVLASPSSSVSDDIDLSNVLEKASRSIEKLLASASTLSQEIDLLRARTSANLAEAEAWLHEVTAGTD